MVDKKLTINDVADSLIAVGVRLSTQWAAHGWSLEANAQTINFANPSISINEILAELEIAATRLRSQYTSRDHEQGKFAGNLKLRADTFAVGNVSSDPGAILLGVLELSNSVFRNIPPAPPPKIDWEDIKADIKLIPKDLARRLRFIDARLNELEPRSAAIEGQIADIEAAHMAAEQLPTDLADLATRKEDLNTLMESVVRIDDTVSAANIRVEDSRVRIENAEIETKERIKKAHDAAENMIKRSEQALRGATSVGLAKAFEERRAALAKNGFWWTFGLIAALFFALAVGWERLDSLKSVLSGDKPASVIWANAMLAVLGVGAPIWFAWLSTKQIGTTFRLAEDYAFKASVSQAYEGYRAEAVEIDPVLRERLFATALARIEEAPIRLIDGENHSSPMSELLSRPGMRMTLESIPGIADKIIALIPAKAGIAAAIAAPVAAAAIVAKTVEPDSDNDEDA